MYILLCSKFSPLETHSTQFSKKFCKLLLVSSVIIDLKITSLLHMSK